MTDSSVRWAFQDLASVVSWLQAKAAAGADAPSQAATGVIKTMATELELVRHSAMTVVVSPIEANLLQALLPESPVTVISNVHDLGAASGAAAPSRRAAPRLPGCKGRRGTLFVGNLNHLPNQQAISAMVDDVLPQIAGMLSPQERGEFVLHIVGSNAAVEADLSRPGGLDIQFHGWLPDRELDVLYDSVRVVVAPLMSGAGVKGKVNQAMLRGVPVVVTPVAAEGMHLVDGRDTMVAKYPAEFAAKVVQLLRDCSLWDRLSAGGLANVNEYFSRAAATQAASHMMSRLGFTVPAQRAHVCSHEELL
jgi:O-antigen biosynthesis protein